MSDWTVESSKIAPPGPPPAPTDDQVWRAYGEWCLMKRNGCDDFNAMKRALVMGRAEPVPGDMYVQCGKDYFIKRVTP